MNCFKAPLPGFWPVVIQWPVGMQGMHCPVGIQAGGIRPGGIQPGGILLAGIQPGGILLGGILLGGYCPEESA